MTNLMIDIETFGNGPTAVIQQIGWCVFDETVDPDVWQWDDHGNIFVSIDSCLEHGLTTNQSCLHWWLQQSEEARKSACRKGSDLKVGISALNSIIQKYQPTRYWCTAPSFDFAILDNGARACGKKINWNRRELLCMRTVRRLTSHITREQTDSAVGLTFLESDYVAHNAEHDAVAQAVEACVRLRELNSK